MGLVIFSFSLTLKFKNKIMKKSFLIIIVLFFGTVLSADNWTEMTLEQAQKAVEHIEENPYIFDYCDCCKGEKVNLIYVEAIYYEVEEFSNVYEVQAIGRIIHTFNFIVWDDSDDEFAILDSFLPPEGESDFFDEVISANYTFVFSDVTGEEISSISLFKITGYDYSPSNCVAFMQYLFPNSDDNQVDEGYKNWYYKKINY